MLVHTIGAGLIAPADGTPPGTVFGAIAAGDGCCRHEDRCDRCYVEMTTVHGPLNSVDALGVVLERPLINDDAVCDGSGFWHARFRSFVVAALVGGCVRGVGGCFCVCVCVFLPPCVLSVCWRKNDFVCGGGGDVGVGCRSLRRKRRALVFREPAAFFAFHLWQLCVLHVLWLLPSSFSRFERHGFLVNSADRGIMAVGG